MVNCVLYLFGSGLCFFIGAGCVLLGLMLLAVRSQKWHLAVSNGTCLLGALLVACSAAPLPYWYYGLALAGTVTLAVVEQQPWKNHRRSRLWLRGFVGLCWLTGVGIEVAYQIPPVVSRRDSPHLYIIADSITAGVDEPGEITWPQVLAQTHPSVKVSDYSRMGATVESAMNQAERLPTTGGIVLLEIGGNDLLGTTTPPEFERHLERLLKCVVAGDRTTSMFELPLPPLCNQYGLIQRRLAARHSVLLIPKRQLIGVLSRSAATTDSIHLSHAGHRQMADVVWRLIGPAYPD